MDTLSHLFSSSSLPVTATALGTVINHLWNINRVHHYMTDLARKHKTNRMLSPFRSEIYTSNPANVEYILKTNATNYGKAGTRICLGIKGICIQANEDIFSYIVRMLQVSDESDHEKIAHYKIMITMHIDGGLHVHAFPRLGCQSQ